MYVHAVRHSLLESKQVHRLSLQDVDCGCDELVEAPTPLLVCLKYTGKYRNQMHLQTPVETVKSDTVSKKK